MVAILKTETERNDIQKFTVFRCSAYPSSYLSKYKETYRLSA